jgi:hypothetical protein
MPIGYMRVSKAEGSPALDLQRDALLAARWTSRLYRNAASDKRDDRPGLEASLEWPAPTPRWTDTGSGGHQRVKAGERHA